MAHRFWNRLSSSARTPIAQSPRVHRRHTCLYGSRTNRANEPLNRFAERPLFTWDHALRNAHRQSSVPSFRFDGMGALPHCETPPALLARSARAPESLDPRSGIDGGAPIRNAFYRIRRSCKTNSGLTLGRQEVALNAFRVHVSAHSPWLLLYKPRQSDYDECRVPFARRAQSAPYERILESPFTEGEACFCRSRRPKHRFRFGPLTGWSSTPEIHGRTMPWSIACVAASIGGCFRADCSYSLSRPALCQPRKQQMLQRL